MKLGYLGPRTNSEIAAKSLNRDFEHVVLGSMDEVIKSLSINRVDRILIPVKNSVTGLIENYLQRIEDYKFKVVDEITVPIKHSFAVARNRKSVGFIMSHGQVLKQCADYLEKNYAETYKEEMKSTDSSARFVAEIGHGAAIAPLETCRYYGLIVKDEDIVKNNYSLFYICKK